MEVVINIKTDNAAFEGVARSGEIARILEKVVARLRDHEPFPYRLMDINGNHVGYAEWKRPQARKA